MYPVRHCTPGQTSAGPATVSRHWRYFQILGGAAGGQLRPLTGTYWVKLSLEDGTLQEGGRGGPLPWRLRAGRMRQWELN